MKEKNNTVVLIILKKVINENHNCTYIDIDNNDLKVYFDDFCN